MCLRTTNGWSNHPWSITTSAAPRTTTNTLAYFCKGIPAIQRSGYETRLPWSPSVLTPLAQNFLPKLKRHLLPRVLTALQSQTSSSQSSDPVGDQSAYDPNTVLFKHDRMYQHNLARFNYTSYDVRRSEDVVNASTPHHNIMVLSDESDSTTSHPFKYAQVLGIYHTNVVYVGPGMVDYQPRRMEFLWVRWYESTGMRAGWRNHRLDRIRFPPMSTDDAFGFVDPTDVLRACHIIPAFAKGRLHVDGVGLSWCTQDSSDWVEYYVNR